MINTTFVSNNKHGWGSLSILPDEVKRWNVSKVLIITDPFLVQNGTVQKITRLLDTINVESIVNSNIIPEPPLEVAEQLVDFARQISADLVIGLGGGSALDIAKLVAALIPQQGKVADYLNLSGTKTFTHPSLPKIMIPTTSGTGSEVTNISVLSLESTKDAVVHNHLLADTVIVDPELTLSVPSKVTAATGIDALTHAIESYVSIYATPITEGLSLQAIRLISKSLVTAVKDGSNRQARTDMSYGSYLAGLAFFNAGCAAIHALAYPLGGQFHLPHGESNAVLMPYVMSYIRPSCKAKLKDIFEAMGNDVKHLDEDTASIMAIDALRELVEEVNIPQTLQSFNIPKQALPTLSQDAIKQTRLLQRSPMPLALTDIEKIYDAAFHGNYFK